jgi:delta-aminolevulinic acid dehydratase/porphobilinogen synthase
MATSRGTTTKLYTRSELEELSSYVCSKTISHQPELELKPSLFCQPIDIAIDLKGNATQPIANMANYPMRSAQNTLEHIAELLEIGIRAVMVRMDSPSAYGSYEKILKRQATIIAQIRRQFSHKELTIIVDPFSVALNPDKTWGVQTEVGLDYLKTVELFAHITEVFTKAGGDYILTLGRFEREVDVASRMLDQTQSSTQVASFSTNTETTNAYVYADHGAYAVTKQKILVSNYQEMVFRAIVDLYEGSRLIIVKPAENLHVLEKVTTLLRHPELLKEFLGSKRVRAMTHQSIYLEHIRKGILKDVGGFVDRAANTGLGAYTVSGTYFMDMQTLDRKGNPFLTSLLYERFCNIMSVLNDWQNQKLIVDRNAYWFFKHSWSALAP